VVFPVGFYLYLYIFTDVCTVYMQGSRPAL